MPKIFCLLLFVACWASSAHANNAELIWKPGSRIKVSGVLIEHGPSSDTNLVKVNALIAAIASGVKTCFESEPEWTVTYLDKSGEGHYTWGVLWTFSTDGTVESLIAGELTGDPFMDRNEEPSSPSPKEPKCLKDVAKTLYKIRFKIPANAKNMLKMKAFFPVNYISVDRAENPHLQNSEELDQISAQSWAQVDRCLKLAENLIPKVPSEFEENRKFPLASLTPKAQTLDKIFSKLKSNYFNVHEPVRGKDPQTVELLDTCRLAGKAMHIIPLEFFAAKYLKYLQSNEITEKVQAESMEFRVTPSVFHVSQCENFELTLALENKGNVPFQQSEEDRWYPVHSMNDALKSGRWYPNNNMSFSYSGPGPRAISVDPGKYLTFTSTYHFDDKTKPGAVKIQFSLGHERPILSHPFNIIVEKGDCRKNSLAK